jgi:arylformamidase
MRTHAQPKEPLDYRNQVAVPDFNDYFAAWKRDSEQTRKDLRCEIDVRYGAQPRQVCDVFPGARGGAPVLIFIHGGWWYFLDKSDFSYVVRPFVERDAVVVNVNYPLAPAARMGDIVSAVREAVLWVRENVSRWGGDPGNISIAGHSAGGHLSTCMSFTDWSAHGIVGNPIRANCPVSGLYDLMPILNAPQNERIQMRTEDAQSNSPIDRVVRNGTRHVPCVGGSETTGFLWQHKIFLEACEQQRVPLTDTAIPGKHHFNIVDELGRAESSVFRALWSEMSATD